MADIKRLLRKKRWTGRELGIIALTNIAVLYKQGISGKPRKRIVERERFQEMLDSMKDQQQAQIYYGYTCIHKWLTIQINAAQTQLQQAQVQFRTLEGFLGQFILAENVVNYIQQLPAIMTEKQYKDTNTSGNYRATKNGVAVIQQSELLDKARIDKNGHYVEPVIESLAENSLEGFFAEAKNAAFNRDLIGSSRFVLLSSYYFLMGYNYAIDKIIAIHDVPDWEVFKSNISILDERIDNINELAITLYKTLKNTSYSDKELQELQERKLQVMRDFFKPIDYKALAIPEANKEKADALITDFTLFNQSTYELFNDLLCALPETETEEET